MTSSCRQDLAWLTSLTFFLNVSVMLSLFLLKGEGMSFQNKKDGNLVGNGGRGHTYFGSLTSDGCHRNSKINCDFSMTFWLALTVWPFLQLFGICTMTFQREHPSRIKSSHSGLDQAITAQFFKVISELTGKVVFKPLWANQKVGANIIEDWIY